MEMKFTASVGMALEHALKLARGALWVLPKGCQHLANLEVRQEWPVWCNFTFFHRIEASSIRRTERVEPTPERSGSWNLSREVEFFYDGRCLVVIKLAGRRYDGQGDLDNSSFWAVSNIGYFQTFSGGLHGVADGWREVEIEVTDYRARLVV